MIENIFNNFYCIIDEIVNKISEQFSEIQVKDITLNTMTNFIISKLKDFEIYKTISNFKIFKIIFLTLVFIRIIAFSFQPFWLEINPLYGTQNAQKG